MCLMRADRIICVSNTEKEQLVVNYPHIENKVKIIPNGIDLKAIQKAKPHEQDQTNLLYIGRLEKYKNIDRIIHAMKALPDDHQFNVIGSGPDKDRLINMAMELGVEKKVKFLGNVTDSVLY